MQRAHTYTHIETHIYIHTSRDTHIYTQHNAHTNNTHIQTETYKQQHTHIDKYS